MAPSNWLRFLRNTRERFSVRKTRPSRKATLERKLFLEPLEDRTVLSPYVVTTTADGGSGSLRDAINQINADVNADGSSKLSYTNSGGTQDEIDFQIPWNSPTHFYYKDDGIAGQVTAADIAAVPTIAIDGFTPITRDAQLADPSTVGIGNTIDPDQAHSWWSITPQSGLPMITNSVIINGATQAGWVANTSDTLYNAKLPIVLDGSNAGASEALLIAGGNSTVEGLQIQNFANGGIHLLTAGNDSILGNNIQYVGFGGDPNDQNFGGGGGVYIDGVAGNIIGGATLDARNKFWYDGISVDIRGAGARNNQVLGNVIGTDGTTEQTSGSSFMGVLINDASDNTIGGTAPCSKNVITGGLGGGGDNAIEIWGDTGSVSSGNVVQGNFIDTDTTGCEPLPSDYLAIGLDGVVSNTLIGGPTASARNVIGGAGGEDRVGGIGIALTFAGFPLQISGTMIEGNYIGVDATGAKAFGGQEAEYGINGNPGEGDNSLGEDFTITNTSIVGNVISGWGQAALVSPGSGATIIEGNLIGTDSTGLHPLPNGAGISGFNGEQIGGTISGQGNIIAYNNGPGVEAGGTGVRIEGNAIYRNTGPYPAIDNLGQGLNTPVIDTNWPGGPFTGTDNASLSVTQTQTTTQTGSTLSYSGTLTGGLINSRYLVTLAAQDIDSGWYGSYYTYVFTDDNGDATFTNLSFPAPAGFPSNQGSISATRSTANPPHSLGNYEQNYPVLASASSGSSTVVTGTLNGEANTTFTVGVYANPSADPSGYGQGQYYLGYATVTTDANGNASFGADFSCANLPGGTLPIGWSVSATATDPGGNTSEFSADETTAPATQTFSQYLQATLPQNSRAPAVISIEVGPDQLPPTVIAAVNSLANVTQPVTIIYDLGGGTYSSGDVPVNPPPNVTFIVQNGTLDPANPALTVSGGQVSVVNCTLATSGNAPTLLVTGGSLTLRNDVIQASASDTGPVISVSGGRLDIGTAQAPGANTFNFASTAQFLANFTQLSAVGDTFEINGVAVAPPPTLGALSVINVSVGHSYSGSIAISNGNGPFRIQRFGGLGNFNAVISGSNILISGTAPTTAQMISFSITIQDSMGFTATQQYDLIINPYTVTNTSTNSSVVGSLPYEVAQADSDTSGTVVSINFAAGPGQTFATPWTIELAGTLNLDNTTPGESIIIDGPASGLTVAGGGFGSDFSVFTVATSTTAFIFGLTITNGYTKSDGGGIDNAGVLELVGCNLEGNSANTAGGAIYNSGTLTLTNSSLSGNSTNYSYPEDGIGGGIYNAATMTVSESIVDSNTAFDGAGIANWSGTLTVSNSYVSGNYANYEGGGVLNSGALTVNNSTFFDNSASGGGGIYNAGTMTASNSTLADNTAGSVAGSNIEISGTSYPVTYLTQGTGGAIENDGTLTISESTLANNSATYEGGGIWNFRTLMVSDSTLCGNSAGFEGGGIWNEAFANVTVTNSTLSGNGASFFDGAAASGTAVPSR